MIDDRKRVTHTDVVVIGAGIGGLCCAAMLARYGYRVTVCEAHSIPGGVAHAFEVDGYHFDSGPSSHTGLTDPHTTNALRQVLDLLGEEVPCTRWDRWMMNLPEGTFVAEANSEGYTREIAKFAGAQAAEQWRRLEKRMEVIAAPMEAFPAAAVRYDLGAILSMGRYPKAVAGFAREGRKFLQPFSELIATEVRDPFVKHLMDVESFIISGLTAKDTLAGVMAMCWRDRNKSTVDYPHGGMQGLINGLVRGFTRYGGKLLLNASVNSIIVENGRAVGVELQRGGRVLAKHAVVCNASIWDTLPLLPKGALPRELEEKKAATPQTDSFLHLHVGIDAKGLPKDLESHHVSVKHWDVRAPGNVVIISIPSLLDSSLAPAGKHCIHAYLAGNEPYDLWQGLKRTQPEYKALKEQRAQRLWEALEEVIPDVRKRVDLSLVGSPLTIERFCRRTRGTYGPALVPGEPGFPGPKHLPIKGLLHCGDSTMPGIGIPAAAASGVAAAHALVPVWKQWEVLDTLDRYKREGYGPRFTHFQPGEPVKSIAPRMAEQAAVAL